MSYQADIDPAQKLSVKQQLEQREHSESEIRSLSRDALSLFDGKLYVTGKK